jgi:hypothetical protein
MAGIPHVQVGKTVRASEQNALIDQVNINTSDIEYLKTTGGGTSEDPFVDWFTGEGPPPMTIVGAARGDMYIDTLTGQLYQLN